MQYEDNRKLLQQLGGDVSKYHTNFEVRKAILEKLGGDPSNCNTIFETDMKILDLYESGNVSGGGGSTPAYKTGTKFANSTWDEIPSIDYSKITDFSGMFANCGTIQEIPKIDTSNGINFDNMFYSCGGLQYVSALDTSKGTNFFYMFSNDTELQTIEQLDFSSAVELTDAFAYCRNLSEVRLKGSVNTNVCFDQNPKLSDDSIKSILTACANTTNNDDKLLWFKKSLLCENENDYADLKELISQCTSKGWNISGLNFIESGDEVSLDIENGWLDTGVTAVENEKIEVKMAVFGCDNECGVGRGGASNGALASYFSAERNTFNMFCGGFVNDYAYGYNYGEDVTITMQNGLFTFNGTHYTCDVQDLWNNSDTLKLGNFSDEHWMGKVYYIKIYEGDTLTHNFIPNSTGDGLIDEVTGDEIFIQYYETILDEPEVNPDEMYDLNSDGVVDDTDAEICGDYNADGVQNVDDVYQYVDGVIIE